jgi:hypothetical protein
MMHVVLQLGPAAHLPKRLFQLKMAAFWVRPEDGGRKLL